MRKLRDVVLIVFGAVGILALARQAVEPDALEAVGIPNAQEDVDTDFVSVRSSFFTLVPNSSVTIDNGNQTRRVVIQFSAEISVGKNSSTGVPDRAELGYAFTKNAGTQCFPQAGPLYFASNNSDEVRTAIHVPTLGPGTWTIQPCLRVFRIPSGSGGVAAVRIRTLTAERMTS